MVKKIVFGIVFLASLVVLSVFLSSAVQYSKETKNYGLCVVNATKQKNICIREANLEFLDCIKSYKNLSNRSEIKEKIKACKNEFKENLEECKNSFKNLKENCLRLKNNQTEKNNSKDCKVLKEDIKEEFKNLKKCKEDSDCVIGNISLICRFVNDGFFSYNNSDLSKILNLSSNYTENCGGVCLLDYSKNSEEYKAVCENGKCNLRELKKEYCKFKKEKVFCPTIYNPVCGWFNSSIKCLVYPCAQEFSNSCVACSNPNVEYWTEGKCPSIKEL